MSVFDLSISFGCAWVIKDYIGLTGNEIFLYIFPVGVLAHFLTYQDTFLNSQLMNFRGFNIYQAAFLINMWLLLQSWLKAG
jgi:hypothetical protein